MASRALVSPEICLFLRVLASQLIQAVNGHVLFHRVILHELRQHALSRARLVENGTEEELRLEIFVWDFFQEELRGYFISDRSAATTGRCDAYPP